MGKLKEQIMDLEVAGEIFGDFNDKFIIASDVENLKEGEIVTLVNSNCEFEFDNVMGVFNDNLYYYYIVDLELLEMNLDNYKRSKSNNGGCYGFATCRVLKVHEKTY